MTNLLYIEASPRKARSQSIAVARKFLDVYRAAHPDGTIDTLDLWAESLPQLDGPTIDAKYAILAGQRHSPAEREAWAKVEEVVSRFAAAERYLVSVPMWNFNVPYVLKHFIDIVTQPTLTFSFSPEIGYRGLITGKAAVVIYASSGDYADGSSYGRPDFQKPFFEAWLRFIGIEDIETIAVQPTIVDAGRLAASRKAALSRAAELARNVQGGQAMTRELAWILLLVSGLLDVAWALSMKLAEGYTRPGWSILSFGFLAAFVWLLGRSLEVLPVGTAYAVWTGVGAIGTVVLGAALFHEPLTALRLFCIALIFGGILGLRLSSA